MNHGLSHKQFSSYTKMKLTNKVDALLVSLVLKGHKPLIDIPIFHQSI
jgi:hypothetical protein